jgi:hypothetical protein
MRKPRRNRLEEPRGDSLLPGLNGVETCLTLSEDYGDFFWGRKLMERAKVRAILQTLNAAIDNALDVLVHDIPAKVVSVGDLLLLKLLAIPDRPDPVKAMQDRTDVAALVRDNSDKISREDIRYLARSLRDLVFTREDARKYADLLRWLNETLELLGMADRRYEEQDNGLS